MWRVIVPPCRATAVVIELATCMTRAARARVYNFIYSCCCVVHARARRARAYSYKFMKPHEHRFPTAYSSWQLSDPVEQASVLRSGRGVVTTWQRRRLAAGAGRPSLDVSGPEPDLGQSENPVVSRIQTLNKGSGSAITRGEADGVELVGRGLVRRVDEVHGVPAGEGHACRKGIGGGFKNLRWGA
jgi:hypothetical protein